MEPRLVSFDQMRVPEVVGRIGDTEQEFISLSGISSDWEKYVVETSFIPAAFVSQDKVVRPSLKQLAKTCQKFRRIFVGRVLYKITELAPIILIFRQYTLIPNGSSYDGLGKIILVTLFNRGKTLRVACVLAL